LTLIDAYAILQHRGEATMRMPINAKGIQMIKITNINNNKVIDAEIYDIKPDKITVILPGFQKLTLNKVPNKPGLYVANQFGMEFHARYGK
jgi:hypothetical protein